ncbi:Verru_Chthon cassette protein C [Verrucomicrobium sp. BvORR034]|uniref:Verru_Chthon cassette protein C n=1 Tax=Verrucomicrobium sp. BvORR034 TaxID=1396418 RepID=UPI0006790943|nr:Verru_Chthon cassette protein C [Verrucomicrobium sp. BvORR034]
MNPASPSPFSFRRAAFTLVEVLLSITVLSLIMTLLVNTLAVTQRVYTGAQSRVEQFREARVAFESITRRLSQATLNPYWDYNDPNAPTRYVRQSELHFICGPSATLLNQSGLGPKLGHAVFFQAPMGVADDTAYRELNSSLNAWGFYLSFEEDTLLGTKPSFLGTRLNARRRCRLMEFRQPTERFQVYAPPGGAPSGFKGMTTAPFAATTAWYNNPELVRDTGITPALLQSRPLAENIIALVFSPRSPVPSGSSSAKDYDIAPDYSYDSRRFLSDPASPVASLSRHQLPPTLQVTMVALDEASASRYERGGGSTAELVDAAWFKEATKHEADLLALTARLSSLKLDHQVFTTTVSIRSAKWSTTR